ncbi:MAG: hypothetical protein KIT89_04435 [Microcella sp.]|uniref:hypothetical protein n=1 Tax=Microcella sp. TaxID=1913979 RepID=UPI0024C9AC16|nr:hypothetical protein [Microcella sp.]UYN84445.1 MAG: hypothetical protein KIT89_04435 [Microcella sp.]
MTVLKADNALYVALKMVPEGTRMTVYTSNQGSAKTNVVAELRKEPGSGWDDWQFLKRPATANAELLPATWPNEDPTIISSTALAESLGQNPDLWADISD